MRPRCENCRYFSEAGECRRYPPQVVESIDSESAEYTEQVFVSSTTLTYWPDVEPDSWCGEFKEKDEEES